MSCTVGVVSASAAGYYGWAPVLTTAPSERPNAPPAESMECEWNGNGNGSGAVDAPGARKRGAAPIPPGRAPHKRFRACKYEPPQMMRADHRPTVAETYARTTHNNPDISRCLMAYII